MSALGTTGGPATANTHIALLRGINVGRARRVAMADLRALAVESGLREPRTLLNSGNLVFDAGSASTTESAAALEGALAARLGIQARVIALSAGELAAILRECPLLPIAADPSRLLVGVTANPADLALLRPLVAQEWGAEALALGARAAYLWCPGGVIASRLAQAASRALGDAVTTRNWATMGKLAAMVEEQP